MQRNARLYRTHFGPYFSEASRLLWMILSTEGEGPEWIRHQLELGKSVANRYLYGDSRPDLGMAVRIHQRFPTVEPRLWLEKPTRRFVLPGSRPRKAA